MSESLEKEKSTPFWQILVVAIISGALVSTVAGIVFTGHVTKVTEEIRSQRTWKERSVEELLGPMNIQLDRTWRAFGRWKEKNLYLEAKVLKVGNETIRDLLLTKGHLIPPDLLNDAGMLVQHYDVWLELFERLRGGRALDSTSAFVYAEPEGYPFPKDAETHFKAKFDEYWKELYGGK